jgi:hypothetical protein
MECNNVESNVGIFHVCRKEVRASSDDRAGSVDESVHADTIGEVLKPVLTAETGHVGQIFPRVSHRRDHANNITSQEIQNVILYETPHASVLDSETVSHNAVADDIVISYTLHFTA